MPLRGFLTSLCAPQSEDLGLRMGPTTSAHTTGPLQSAFCNRVSPKKNAMRTVQRDF